MNKIGLSRLPIVALFAVSASVHLAPPVDAAEPTKVTVEVKPHNGRPMIHIDGVPKALPVYSPVGWSTNHFKAAVPFFTPHRMGAYFLVLPWAEGQGWAGTQLWDGDTISSTPIIKEVARGRPTLQEQVQFILERDPGARFFVRGLPDWPPSSWMKLHQDQMFVTEDGKKLEAVPSLASERFWTDLARAERAAITHVESQPWGGRVLGYWVGMFGEGTYIPLYTYSLFDHSPIMAERWRAFLRARYRTVEALRLAHNSPEVTFENAPVPRDQLLGRQEEVAGSEYWQDASGNQPRRDYLELAASLLHSGYRKVMAAAGEAAQGRKLCLYDAFKLPMQGWNLQGFFDLERSWWPAFPEMMSGGGYLNMARLFDAPGFDGLITPHDYQARGIGGVYQPEGMADSTILRGKFFFSEMDLRTYNIQHDDYGSARDNREYAALSWRNFADSFTRGYSSYWMDLCGGVKGWFGNAGLQEIIGRQVQVIRESVDWRHEDVPGIAMVLDDTSVLETNGSGNYLNEAVMWEQKMGLARCGVPFRIYLLDDLALDQFPRHRVFYFPNLFRADGDRIALLKQKVFRDGNVVLWGPGSGISDGKTIAAAHAAGLTGFDFEPLMPSNHQRRVLVTNFSHPVTAGLSADTVIGGPLAYGPGLYPKDGIVLGAAWTKQGRNYAGLAVKEFGKGARDSRSEQEVFGSGDWASVFTAAVPVPASLWRNLARYAGAHIYCESNDILMADKTVVALHSARPGPKTIRLPGRCRVTDVVTGKLVGRRADTIRFTLERADTRVFRLGKVR